MREYESVVSLTLSLWSIKMNKMKKIFSGLIVLSTVLMLSSCIIVSDNDFDDILHYDFTFVNDTNEDIADWYLKSEDGDKYAISSNYEEVLAGENRKLRNVPMDDYKVYFLYSADKASNQYYYSNYFFLNKDKRYSLKNDVVSPRSATVSDTTTEKVFYLEDEDGNQITLMKE